ncbi:BREX-6 system BrxE protein [Vulcanococcus limneticus]|uniref:BREX-6 system BrxE protein n=1 Tax=Vulcanococcus limneticus TaxID=2170428 RepID=UPI00398BCC88
MTLLELTADPGGQPANHRGSQVVTSSDLDLALTAQIAVAWAGEGGEEPRLSWWQTDLVSEFGGEDLLRRLLPKTYPWAVFQAVREAARRKDEELRAKASDPDQLVTLFRFGFELDEQIEERLQTHKRSGLSPQEALPGLVEVLGATLHEPWDRAHFEQWVEGYGPAQSDPVPTGRQLKGTAPTALDRRVQQLVAALAPLSDAYPLPHFRVKP